MGFNLQVCLIRKVQLGPCTISESMEGIFGKRP